jgi:hypothetical protein
VGCTSASHHKQRERLPASLETRQSFLVLFSKKEQNFFFEKKAAKNFCLVGVRGFTASRRFWVSDGNSRG